MQTVPVEIIHVILEQLVDRRDLHAAALTSRVFNASATPLLYRTLDSDTRSRTQTKEVGITTATSITLVRLPSMSLN